MSQSQFISSVKAMNRHFWFEEAESSGRTLGKRRVRGSVVVWVFQEVNTEAEVSVQDIY